MRSSRRVFRVATTYAILTFIALQIADAVLDTLAIPPQYFSVLLAILAVGFPVVILLAWFFEITPQGIFLDRRKTSTIMNRPVAITGIVLLTGIAIGFALAIYRYSDTAEVAYRDDIAIAVLPFDNLTGDPRGP